MLTDGAWSLSEPLARDAQKAAASANFDRFFLSALKINGGKCLASNP